MAKWLYFVSLFYYGNLEKHLEHFLFVKCKFLFFKVANDQLPAADSELIIACLIIIIRRLIY